MRLVETCLDTVEIRPRLWKVSGEDPARRGVIHDGCRQIPRQCASEP
jgi:hypothetical protein